MHEPARQQGLQKPEHSLTSQNPQILSLDYTNNTKILLNVHVWKMAVGLSGFIREGGSRVK